jgi:hypothetical protein
MPFNYQAGAAAIGLEETAGGTLEYFAVIIRRTPRFSL